MFAQDGWAVPRNGYGHPDLSGIWANNSAFSASFNLNISSSLLDTDGDGEPDITDSDDDNDGWNDTLELDCDTDPLDIVSSPDDYDGDFLCDLND